MVLFYIPWKHQKAGGFLGIEKQTSGMNYVKQKQYITEIITCKVDFIFNKTTQTQLVKEMFEMFNKEHCKR